MYDNYYDIKQFSRPHYDDHPQMSISDRAAQFSPFAALTGYDAAVDETARYTEIREELTEDELEEIIDQNTQIAAANFAAWANRANNTDSR